MQRDLPAALAVLWLLGMPSAHASDLYVGELPTIVVTPSSVDGSAFTVPHGITVITASDIAKATSSNLGELLSREAGLSLKSFSGSDKFATVDIRGMGDTAVSNVLVMVDGPVDFLFHTLEALLELDNALAERLADFGQTLTENEQSQHGDDNQLPRRALRGGRLPKSCSQSTTPMSLIGSTLSPRSSCPREEVRGGCLQDRWSRSSWAGTEQS